MWAHILPEYSSTSNRLEQLWLEVDVPNHKKMLIINVYRPPSTNAIQLLRENLKKYDDLHKREIVIMGDLNINVLKSTSLGCVELKEFCRDFNFTQIIKEPTRITHNTRTLIDIIITNMNFVKSCGVLDYVISDHLPIYVIRKQDRNHKEYTYSEGRNMKSYKIEDFKFTIQRDIRWVQFWEADTVYKK